MNREMNGERAALSRISRELRVSSPRSLTTQGSGSAGSLFGIAMEYVVPSHREFPLPHPLLQLPIRSRKRHCLHSGQSWKEQ